MIRRCLLFFCYFLFALACTHPSKNSPEVDQEQLSELITPDLLIELKQMNFTAEQDQFFNGFGSAYERYTKAVSGLGEQLAKCTSPKGLPQVLKKDIEKLLAPASDKARACQDINKAMIARWVLLTRKCSASERHQLVDAEMWLYPFLQELPNKIAQLKKETEKKELSQLLQRLSDGAQRYTSSAPTPVYNLLMGLPKAETSLVAAEGLDKMYLLFFEKKYSERPFDIMQASALMSELCPVLSEESP